MKTKLLMSLSIIIALALVWFTGSSSTAFDIPQPTTTPQTPVSVDPIRRWDGDPNHLAVRIMEDRPLQDNWLSRSYPNAVNPFPQIPGAATGVPIALAAGNTHTCALTSSGGVRCWGDNWRGQLGDGTIVDHSTPADVTGLTSGVVAISSLHKHTCALTSGGGVKCWGSNIHGELGNNSTVDSPTAVDVVGLSSGVIAISAGGFHTCALTSGGGVKCWGANWHGEVGDGSTDYRYTPADVVGLGSGVIAIAAGKWHTCALLGGGGMKCWGYNVQGELGNGTTGMIQTTPVDVTNLTSGVTAIAAGAMHTCALVSGGGMKCWGDNSEGQLGDGTTIQRLTPVSVSGLQNGVASFTLGTYHTCALTSSGCAKCWGDTWTAQLGDGTTTPRLTPVDVPGLTSGVTALEAGDSHTCAIVGGRASCWGSNGFGQIGDGTTAVHLAPTDVSGLTSGVSMITTGWLHACALTSAGGVMCWGDNTYGQLGDGTTTNRVTPVDVVGLTSGVISVRAGGFHTCALTSTGGVKCWGYNFMGQVGDGTTQTRLLPVNVIGLADNVTALALGYAHTCALVDGGIQCWGQNLSGQIGDGTTSQRLSPVWVVDLSGWWIVSIEAGESHTCAIIIGGMVKCWGNNFDGQLGNNSTTDSSRPVDVAGLTSGIASITAGVYHTCAMANTGGIKCWGGNFTGQLGDGTTQHHYTPYDVTGLASGVAALKAGVFHTCALMSGGGVKCWGDNWGGDVGDGTTFIRTMPTNVNGMSTGVSALAGGYSYTCALTTTGGVKCWGIDTSGQIGDGILPWRLNPVVVFVLKPSLAINYISGGPGSFFSLTGSSFLPNDQASITINGYPITQTVPTDPAGNLLFLLSTTNAGEGYYIVTARTGLGATADFRLAAGEPLRPPEGSGPVLEVPFGIAYTRFQYFPFSINNLVR